MCLHAPTVRAHAGGIVDELRVVASGTAVLNLPQDPLIMREAQRSTENTYWLLPTEAVWHDLPLAHIVREIAIYFETSKPPFLCARVYMNPADSVNIKCRLCAFANLHAGRAPALQRGRNSPLSRGRDR